MRYLLTLSGTGAVVASSSATGWSPLRSSLALSSIFFGLSAASFFATGVFAGCFLSIPAFAAAPPAAPPRALALVAGSAASSFLAGESWFL